MSQILKINVIGLLVLLLLACSETTENQGVSQPDKTATSDTNNASNKSLKTPQKSAFTTVEWVDLIPKDDLDALLNPPDYINDIEEGSADDQIGHQLQNKVSDKKKNTRYEQALSSTRIIQEMDGKAIRIPGFIVPLEFGDGQLITSFFLVPFFGACIHVPPPPPNQIIYVDYPEGFKLESLYDPFWVSGKLKVKLVENDIAKAAYVMTMHNYEAYTE